MAARGPGWGGGRSQGLTNQEPGVCVCVWPEVSAIPGGGVGVNSGEVRGRRWWREPGGRWEGGQGPPSPPLLPGHAANLRARWT